MTMLSKAELNKIGIHASVSLNSLQVIARIVDGSVFDEFKQLYGETLVCGKNLT